MPKKEQSMPVAGPLNIRRAAEADFESMWLIFREVVGPGDTYPFSPDTPREDALAYWLGPGVTSFVSEVNGRIVGMYKIVPNQRDQGSHVANASFMVAPAYRGKGAGRQMGIHALYEARRRGFLGMQFNFVVSTNLAAVALWQSLGFVIVGTLPRAFRHPDLGYVDAYIMYRSLEDIVCGQGPGA
jgi:ribosomal protein S18 acetylase RimI-like enzyme